MTTDSKEEWRPVPGFDGWYDVAADGRVRSWKGHAGGPRRISPRLLKPRPIKQGYPVVYLSKDGTDYIKLVHRLVLESFVGPPPDGMEGCHGDGDPANCHLSNLRWDTHTANMRDRLDHDTSPRGERHPKVLLSERDVLEIVSFIEVGVGTIPLARRFAVHPATIHGIKSGRNWGWLTGRVAA